MRTPLPSWLAGRDNAPALAALAFGGDGVTHASQVSRHLAFLPLTALELDLDDPEQRRFGDYELLEQIGAGGMGVVYRARQLSLDREVAIKLLSAGPWASADFIERFTREAQSAARLQHPNIVSIFEVGSFDELNYFSMPLVHGRSLAQRLEATGAFTPKEAARLLRTIAEALDYAHRLGVLHLDLKPGNVLIDANGEPQVADFGLARRLDDAFGADSDEVSGTPSYMAPEQIELKTHRLSPATDIHGLGAILYELLCGEPPYKADTPRETLQLVLTGKLRSPRHFGIEVPADLEAICLKCLAHDPGARYHSARALADDLGRFLDGRAVSVRPLNPLQRFGHWAKREPLLTATIAAAMLALLVGMATTAMQKQRADANAASASERLWESRREAALRLQRDGKGFDALPRLLLNIEEQERAGRSDLAQLERRRAGMLQAQGAMLIDQMLVADANPLAVDISPDGRLLALAMNDLSVRWYDTATLTERGRVNLPDRPSSGGEQRAPLLLRFAGNDRVRVTLEWYVNFVSPNDSDSWLIDLERKALVEPPPVFTGFADAMFSADGHHALLRDQQRRVQLWQVSPWKPLSTLGASRRDFVPWLLGPGAKQAAMLTANMRDLLLHDLPDFSRQQSLRLPGSGVSAWALSHDGRTLALGDFAGHTYLLDMATRRLRPLPTSRGRSVSWLAFSEDDTWLATANLDGTVNALDVASGDALVSGAMQHDFLVRRVDIHRQQHLLVVAGEGEMALWRIPWEDGPRAASAERIAASPLRQDTQLRYASGWSLAKGLLATAGLDGHVRLWRLPQPVLREARATFQVPEKIWFDGRRLVDVAWNRVRIMSIDGTPPTPWLELSQPPGFAALAEQGDALLVTVGPELRIYDARTLRLRHPPIALPNSPQRFLTSADAARIVLGFGESGPDGFGERLQVFDGRHGRRLPGEVLAPGPLRTLALSSDGKRLLVVGPAEAATAVFALEGLHALGEYQHDPFQPAMWGDFRRKGNDVLLALRAPDPRLGEDALVVWNPGEEQAKASYATGSARPLGVIDTAGGPFVAGSQQSVLAPGSQHPHLFQGPTNEESTLVTATTRDGHIVAHAFQRRIQLYDARSGVALGPPLQGGAGAFEIMQQLAFSPDGRHLAALTGRGRWLVWALPPETRAARPLLDELTELNASGRQQTTLRVPAASQRTAWRARDPGAWTSPTARPVPPNAGRLASDQHTIPARAVGTSPLLLDLTSVYNVAPDSARDYFFTVRGVMRPVPPGVQRMGGVDFDIRGFAETGRMVHGAESDEPDHQDWCQPVPAIRIAAVRPLMVTVSRTPIAETLALAILHLHYHDGSSAEVPLRAGVELPGFAGNDQGVPQVFTGRQEYTVLGSPSQTLVAPRLPNPHPDRMIRCLQLRPIENDQPFAFAVYAITVEPATLQPAVVKPAVVKPAVVNRVIVDDGSVTQKAAASPMAAAHAEQR